MPAPTIGNGRCTPVRPTTCAETSVPIASPPANVSIHEPCGHRAEVEARAGDRSADSPTPPNSAAPSTRPARATRANVRVRNSPTGSRSRARQRRITAPAGRRGSNHQPADQGEPTDRQVDPEGPAPAGSLGQPAAEQRSADGRDPEHRADQAHHRRPVPDREHVGDGRLHQHQHPARAESLDHPSQDQHRHAGRQRADHRADHDQPEGGQDHRASTPPVAERAVERQHPGGRQQVRGVDPHQIADTVQLVDHGRQGRRHHRLVELGEQQTGHQGDQQRGETTIRQQSALVPDPTLTP